MSTPVSRTDPTEKVRVGVAKGGSVTHIVDDWAPEIQRRRGMQGLCGVDVTFLTTHNPSEKVCGRCQQVVRKYERDLKRYRNLPSQGVIESCLDLILKEPEVHLAKVIQFRPRS